MFSQLEAIIRISESIAKMSLSPVVTEEHVDEAIRLFRVSTYAATRSGYGMFISGLLSYNYWLILVTCIVVGESMLMGNFKKEVLKAQDELRRRLPIGSRMSEKALLDYLRRKVYLTHIIIIRFISVLI